MKIKSSELEIIINFLNPILDGKCGALLALDLVDVIEEIKPELEKIGKVKQKLIETYALKNDDDSYVVAKNENDVEIYCFGENDGKVKEELEALMNTEIELQNNISAKNLSNDTKIEPMVLGFLIEKGIIIK